MADRLRYGEAPAPDAAGLRHDSGSARALELARAEVELLAGAADAADWSFRAQRLGLQPRGSLPMHTPEPLRRLLRMDWRVARPARRAGSWGVALIVLGLVAWITVQVTVAADQPALLVPGLALAALLGRRLLRRAPAAPDPLEGGAVEVARAVGEVLPGLVAPLAALVATRPCVLVDGERVVRNVDLPLALVAGWRRRLEERRDGVGALAAELRAGEALLRELGALPGGGAGQGEERRQELVRQRLDAEALVRALEALLPRLDAARRGIDPLLGASEQTVVGPDLAPLLRDCLALDERARLALAHGPPTR